MKKSILLSFLFTSLSFFAQAQYDAWLDFHEEPSEPIALFSPFRTTPKIYKGAVKSPIPALDVPFEVIPVEVHKGRIITTTNNTIINIPANAFLDANGTIVTTPVEVFYREFNDPMTVFLSGIPMEVNTPDGDLPMQSAGMFELLAETTEGTPVFINPAAPIKVNITSNRPQNDFAVYNMDEEKGEWEATDQAINFPEIPWEQYAGRIVGRMPVLVNNKVHFAGIYEKNKRTTNRSFSFQMTSYIPKKRKAVANYGGQYTRYYSEFAAWKKLTWVYDGKNAREDRERLKSLRFDKPVRNEQMPFLRDLVAQVNQIEGENALKALPFYVTDIQLTLNLEGDNYLLNFYSDEEVISVPVFPNFQTRSPDVEQKRNQKFYTTYQTAYKKRVEEWKMVEEKYQEDANSYGQRRAIFQSLIAENDFLMPNDLIDAYNEQISAFAPEAKAISFSADPTLYGYPKQREVEIYTLGMCNIDRIMKQLEEPVLAEVQTPDGTPIPYEKIVIFDQKNETIFNYSGATIQIAAPPSENSLAVLLPDNKMGIIKRTDFAKYYAAQKDGKVTLIIEPFERKNTTKAILSEQLATR